MIPNAGTPEGVIVNVGRVRMEHPRVTTESSESFVLQALGNPVKHYISRTRFDHVVSDYDRYPTIHGKVAPTSLMIQATHEAFSQHVGLTLSPEIAWYMIVHEVAICVKNNPDKYAYLFTDKPGEKKIMRVHDDSLFYGNPNNDWAGTIELFRKPLHERLAPGTADLFLPRFSTLTPESEVALILGLMDTASSYYEYRVMTRCGIPAVQITGTAEDWNLVIRGVMHLHVEITELRGYFDDLLGVLKSIVAAVEGQRPDPDFWCSIYKFEDHSGGPKVTGWISAFTAYLQTANGFEMKKDFNWRALEGRGWGGLEPDSFPSHVSKVPFIWEYQRQVPHREYKMMFSAGIYGVEYQGEFLTPQLGFGVFEERLTLPNW